MGDRTEIKNLNSMNFARKAVIAEAERHYHILKEQGSVEMQTMGYDVEHNLTFPLREKETAHDYRYFPDPDLPKVQLSESFIENVKANMPELPHEKIERLQENYSISQYLAEIIGKDPELVRYFETAAAHCEDFTSLANWMVGDIRAWLNENEKSIGELVVLAENMGALITLIDEGKLSKTMASTQVFPKMIDHPELSPQQIIEKHNLTSIDDEEEIRTLTLEVLESNPDKVASYKMGKKGLIGFFIGEIMKKSEMKADPKKVADIAKRMLD